MSDLRPGASRQASSLKLAELESGWFADGRIVSHPGRGGTARDMQPALRASGSRARVLLNGAQPSLTEPTSAPQLRWARTWR